MYSFKRHAQPLQSGNARRQNGFGVDSTQGILHPLPDGRLRPGRDLLADDVVNDGRKQVRIHSAVNMPDAVHDFAEPFVFLPQIRNFRFAV